MQRFRGSGRAALLVACALALAIAFVLPASNANAFFEKIPSNVGLLKPAILWKLVSKPAAAQLSDCVSNNPATVGGSLTVTMGSDSLTCALAPGGQWKMLGKCEPGKLKGYKYLNTAAPGGGNCKLVIVKSNVIKVLAKGTGTLQALASGNPPTDIKLDIGSDRYCAEWPSYDLEKEGKILKVLSKPAPLVCPGAPTCDCTGATQLSFTTGIPTAEASGTLSNWRCSNAIVKACVDNGDCPGGTCVEQIGSGMPMDLEKGGLYTGGGGNSVPLPFPVPDKGMSVTSVTTGDGQTLTLGPSTPGDVGKRHCTKGRTCSNNPAQHCAVNADCGAGTCLDNCLYGPPLPIPNGNNAPTSVCAVNVVDLDASGTAQCDGGASDVSTPLRSVIYLNGDLLQATSPPNVPGIQPCPLCSAQCVGGANATLPCGEDSDCPGSTCDGTPNCIGGPNSGAACTPETSDSAALGDTQNSYPTSQDCTGGQPGQNITANIGGIPIDFALTTGSLRLDAVDQPESNRTFCGYCRDVNSFGTLCFEGDPDPGGVRGCPVPGTGIANNCLTDADCAAPYESCAQRTSGAFSKAAATRIQVAGETDGGCLGDGNPHEGTLVSIFCVPPTFDPTVDSAGDEPGPGAALIYGDAQLQ